MPSRVVEWRQHRVGMLSDLEEIPEEASEVLFNEPNSGKITQSKHPTERDFSSDSRESKDGSKKIENEGPTMALVTPTPKQTEQEKMRETLRRRISTISKGDRKTDDADPVRTKPSIRIKRTSTCGNFMMKGGASAPMVKSKSGSLNRKWKSLSSDLRCITVTRVTGIDGWSGQSRKISSGASDEVSTHEL